MRCQTNHGPESDLAPFFFSFAGGVLLFVVIGLALLWIVPGSKTHISTSLKPQASLQQVNWMQLVDGGRPEVNRPG